MTISRTNESLPLASDFMLPSDLQQLLPEIPTETKLLTGSGSPRRYWRLKFSNSPDLILTESFNIAENKAFFYLAEKFQNSGINVPTVLGISSDKMWYLQTDVGELSLFDCKERRDLIEKAIDLLANVHKVRDIDYTKCYPIAKFNHRAIMWDLNYFKYCFLKTTPGLELDEPGLEDDFEYLANKIADVNDCAFMVRDFQSRNIMVKSDNVSMIDFQGGRLGPTHYDVASFLWQARADFPDTLRSEMITRYCNNRAINEDVFRKNLPYFITIRLLQALGAYGFRGRYEGKQHFLLSIAPAIRNLRQILPTEEFPAITKAISFAELPYTEY